MLFIFCQLTYLFQWTVLHIYNYFVGNFLQDVSVAQNANGDSSIHWILSPHYNDTSHSSAYVDIKRRDSEEWIEVQSNVSVTVLKCPIQSKWLENSEFRVDVNFQESGAPWDCDSITVSYKNPDPTGSSYYYVANCVWFK